MTKIRYPQIKAIYGLLKFIPHMDKEDVVHMATDGRTTSLKEVTHEEAVWLIDWLKTSADSSLMEDDPANKMRRKILSCCYDMNYPKVKGKLDMIAVNRTVAKYGYLKDKGKKRLSDYNVRELPKLVVQFQRMRDHYLEKKTKEYTTNR